VPQQNPISFQISVGYSYNYMRDMCKCYRILLRFVPLTSPARVLLLIDRLRVPLWSVLEPCVLWRLRRLYDCTDQACVAIRSRETACDQKAADLRYISASDLNLRTGFILRRVAIGDPACAEKPKQASIEVSTASGAKAGDVVAYVTVLEFLLESERSFIRERGQKVELP